jgi:hypothetical protein
MKINRYGEERVAENRVSFSAVLIPLSSQVRLQTEANGQRTGGGAVDSPTRHREMLPRNGYRRDRGTVVARVLDSAKGDPKSLATGTPLES